MKKLFIVSGIAITAMFSNFANAQSNTQANNVAEISKTYKDKDKVVDQTVTLGENNTANVSYYFPKGKYAIYVVSDSDAFSEVSFTITGDSMEWETQDKSQRHIVKEGKGFKAKKYIVSNPIAVSNNIGELNFKVDNLNALLANMNAKQQANYSAQTNANINAMATRGQVTTGSARWSKQENASELLLTITTDAANVKNADGKVRVLIYER